MISVESGKGSEVTYQSNLVLESRLTIQWDVSMSDTYYPPSRKVEECSFIVYDQECGIDLHYCSSIVHIG